METSGGSAAGAVNPNKPIEVLVVTQYREPIDLLGEFIGSAKAPLHLNYFASIAEGLEAVQSRDDFGMAITGVGNPGWGDGYTLIPAMKAKGLPVIVISGWGERERANALSKGADDYFALPGKPLDLIKMMEKYAKR